jgi:ADP-ribosyl-[dinitrogen reductase] hydrolase
VISPYRLGDPFPYEVHWMASPTTSITTTSTACWPTSSTLAALRRRNRLLVHCHGDASRTGLVLRTWLIRTEGVSVDEATAHVAERWPHLGLWNASFTAALEPVRPEVR